MLTVPPHVQLHVELLVSKGFATWSTWEAPGLQGPEITGTHGCGVSTPCAAAVAEATCGLAAELQSPKGGTFTTGIKSATVALARPWSKI